MALQSYTDFTIYVNARAGRIADKNEIKAQGAILARLAIQEAEKHALKHLNSTLVDNPNDTEIAARVNQIKDYLGIVRIRDG